MTARFFWLDTCLKSQSKFLSALSSWFEGQEHTHKRRSSLVMSHLILILRHLIDIFWSPKFTFTHSDFSFFHEVQLHLIFLSLQEFVDVYCDLPVKWIFPPSFCDSYHIITLRLGMDLQFLFLLSWIHALVYMYLRWLDLGVFLCKGLGNIAPYSSTHTCSSMLCLWAFSCHSSGSYSQVS